MTGHASATTDGAAPARQVSNARTVAARSLECMATGTLADFDAVIHRNAVNRESVVEPLACRGTGPGAFHASALWLRAAYPDFRHEIMAVAQENDLVVFHTVMSGRHVGPFITYDSEGKVDHVFAPTGKSFACTQSHWLRVSDGKVIEHWANRDDLGQGQQLGWVPPTPLYLLRCAAAKRRARKLD